MQTRARLNLDRKYRKLFLRTKQMSIKGLVDNSCNAFKAVPERRTIHLLSAQVVLRNSEYKY